MPTREIEARIPELLEFAGLAGRARRQDQTLSGGMKRRLTLARALVNDPQLVFLDEPTTGLDPQARHLIWERLRRLTQEGKTIVLTTHFMDEAERLCHRLAIMDHGRIIAEGAPRELIAEHIEPQVVEVYGDGPKRGWSARRVSRRASSARARRCSATREDVAPLLQSLSSAGGAALPAPAREPRRRVPQADRPRAAGLSATHAARSLRCGSCGLAAQLPGLAQARRCRRCSATSPIR